MATEVLLINRADIMRLTGLNGNIDEDKILPHVLTSQDIHLQPIIGTKLLDKCKDLIEAGTIGDAGNEAYNTLVNTYITPTLVFLCMWDFMPFMQYEIANGGIFQHNAENSATPTVEEVNALIQKFRDKADFYGERMSRYLCDNESNYPELTEATSGAEMDDEGQQTFGGWVI